MQKGYFRRLKIDAHNTGTILAAIYNTIPRSKTHPKGKIPYTVDDFTGKENTAKGLSDNEIKQLQYDALENTGRFEKGVIYSDG